MNYNEFEVGDIVTIVDTPYKDCPFFWVDSMDKYMSKQAKIKNKRWVDYRGTFVYTIDLDNGCYSWCGNCFVEKETPDFDTAEDTDIAAFFLLSNTEVWPSLAYGGGLESR